MRARPLAVAVIGLLVGALVLRAVVADAGFFYWDDLILTARAAQYPVWSPELLLYDHDGHFMPLAFVTAWVVTAVAPLHWLGPVVWLLLAQLVAALAVLRMLIMLVGTRWALLIPWMFYLFSPMSLPAFAWWSAALNALPLQAGMAWVIADAVRFVRTQQRRYAVSGLAVLVVTLLFFEKAVLIVPVAFAVAVLVGVLGGRARPIRGVLRRGAPLWVGSGLVLLGWWATYVLVVDLSVVPQRVSWLQGVPSHGALSGLVTALIGGPWSWERWLPATPWAAPPSVTVVLAWLVVAGLLGGVAWTRRRVGLVVAFPVGYLLLTLLLVAVVRGGSGTAMELLRSLRYFADATVVICAALALALRARARNLGRGWGPNNIPRNAARGAVSVVVVLFMASSIWSTLTFARSWAQGPTREYLTNAHAGLTAGGAPLLEQEVPWAVLGPLAFPYNQASRVLAPWAAEHTFAAWTPELRMLDEQGRIVPAQVWWNRWVLPGTEPGCGHRVTGPRPVTLQLSGPLADYAWTARVNYLATQDGLMTLALSQGEWVTVPVRHGLHTVYVRMSGQGDTLRVSAQTPGLEVCFGVGPIGVAAFAE